MKPDSLLFQSSSALPAEIEENLIILHTKSGLYIELNPSGKVIWDLLREPIGIQSLHEKIKLEYKNLSSEDLEEINHFLKEGIEKGIIEENESI